MEVKGLPPAKNDQNISMDPRNWDQFTRHTLIEGRLVRDNLMTQGKNYIRPASEFNG